MAGMRLTGEYTTAAAGLNQVSQTAGQTIAKIFPISKKWGAIFVVSALFVAAIALWATRIDDSNGNRAAQQSNTDQLDILGSIGFFIVGTLVICKGIHWLFTQMLIERKKAQEAAQKNLENRKAKPLNLQRS